MVTILKKAIGCLVGAAAGDALGMPTEDIDEKTLAECYKGRITSYQKALPNHPCSHLNPGQYTDDTQQLILLAESLVEKNFFEIHDFGNKLGQWGHLCRTVLGYDRFSGDTSLSAALDLYRGIDPYSSGKFRSSCGAAMRVAPLGVFYYDWISKLEKAAKESAILTHNHPIAIDSAVLVSHIVAYLMNNCEPLEAVKKSNKLLKTPLREKIQWISENNSQHPQEVALVVGTSASALDTVPMAVHCFIHSPNDFEKVITNAANLVPGDTDSIACIAGALAGTFNGLDAIPEKFKDGLEDYVKLKMLGEKLVSKKSIGNFITQF